MGLLTPSRPLVRSLAIFLALLAAPATGEHHELAVLRAGFLRNFIEYVRWPQERERLVVCAYDRTTQGIALDTLDGYKVQKSTLVARPLGREESPRGCDVVYLSPSDRQRLDGVIEFARGKPVLLVADIEGSAQLGVALALHENAGRLGFDANPTAAQAAGLKLGSRLLQLARRVY